MSNFNKLTTHPETGEMEMATWLDGHFGDAFGVKFDGTHVYHEDFFKSRPISHTVQIHKPTKAYDKQVGGSHYKKMKIQPMQYSMANELDACQHTAIKYITRHEDKAGKKDLYKSLHTVLLLIEEKYEWTDKDSAILEAVMGAMSETS
jgi:hypothetical protein